MCRFFVLLLSIMCILFTHVQSSSRVSIITSVYKGEKYIQQFLDDISKQTIYSQCEHIIINANSPEGEEAYILKHIEHFSNVKYIKLIKDPGLYGVWNIALLEAASDYVITANVDDRMDHSAIESLLGYIEQFPDVDLVYSDLYFTSMCNVPFSSCNQKEEHRQPEFSLGNVIKYCCPGNHPLWKKSMHSRYGLFDEGFKIFGDHEMWIRAASLGAIFKRYPHFTGLFYVGETLSSGQKHSVLRQKEGKKIHRKYKDIWNCP